MGFNRRADLLIWAATTLFRAERKRCTLKLLPRTRYARRILQKDKERDIGFDGFFSEESLQLLSDNEVFANAIEFVLVDASEKSFRKPLVKFEIEDFEAQTQSRLHLLACSCKPQSVARRSLTILTILYPSAYRVHS